MIFIMFAVLVESVYLARPLGRAVGTRQNPGIYLAKECYLSMMCLLAPLSSSKETQTSRVIHFIVNAFTLCNIYCL